ncbi:hypothetical protein P170DRAFT_329615, partial [Aspergillus steynii IBT 23096]
MLQSPTFTFLVGRNRTAFTIHSELVRDISPPLHVLMNNGNMKESREGVAVLEDVEADVFAAFCEYVYSG